MKTEYGRTEGMYLAFGLIFANIAGLSAAFARGAFLWLYVTVLMSLLAIHFFIVHSATSVERHIKELIEEIKKR